MGQAFPIYYIERTPPLEAFIWWAAPPPPGTPRPAAYSEKWEWEFWSVLSVAGPPGIGKSVALRRLETALKQLPDRQPFVFPILDLQQVGNEIDLLNWFLPVAAGVPAFAPPAATAHVGALGDDAERLCQVCGAYCQVLLVDGFEEAAPDWRQKIQEFLLGVLQADNVRIVLMRRDDSQFQNGSLHQKQKAVALEPLLAPSPEEQIRRRLALAHIGPHWSPWDEALDRAILAAGLDARQQAALVAALAPDLTPNPYVNLLLLQRKLARLTRPLTVADYRWCLKQYMTRAGVPQHVDFVINMKNEPGYHADGHFTINSAASPVKKRIIEESLMPAGVVKYHFHASKQLEGGVAALISHL